MFDLMGGFGELINNLIQLSQFMPKGEKKQRSRSGPRSKTPKSKLLPFQVDFKAKQRVINLIQLTKRRTENGSIPSKPSRKSSFKSRKRHSKSSSNKEAREGFSQSIAANRKDSLNKKNKTELNFENQQIEKFTFGVRMRLKHLKAPACINYTHLQQYFDELRNCFEGADNSLFIFCRELHNYYLSPLQPILQMLRSNEELLRRKQKISQLIDNQVNENEALWQKMSPVDAEIFRLKEIIEENRLKIERHHKSREETGTHPITNGSFPRHRPFNQSQPQQLVMTDAIEQSGKGFKLSLDLIDKEKNIGFHQQFYANLQNFSQSWRNQALREKRF